MEKGKATSGRSEPFPGILYSEPGALGLVCNIIAAFIAAVNNIQGDEKGTKLTAIVTGLHLILVGGFLQITAGIMSFRKNDHLVATSLTVFATLWAFQGGAIILSKLIYSDVTKSVLPVYIAFVTIAFSLFICSIFVNFIVPPVLVAMALTLTFESIGLFFTWGKKTAVAFEFLIVLTAMYAVTVMKTKGISQRYILPGFGNAPIDPLLIKRNASRTNKKEKRKNTKYAEPMGMGYMGSIIPVSVVCFHGLGYVDDMTVPILAVSCGALLQIIASYYSFLRGDLLYSVQFLTHFLFWTSKSLVYQFSGSADSFSSYANFYGSWGLVLVLAFFTICSSTQSIAVFLYNCLLTVTSILSMEHIPLSIQNYTFGLSAILIWLFTVYLSTAHLLNACAEKPVLPLGSEITTEERLFGCCLTKNNAKESRSMTDEDIDNERRDQTINVLLFLCNMVASFALSPFEISNRMMSLPFLLTAGIFGNLLVARFSYVLQSLSRCFIALSCCFLWTSWSLYIFDATGIAISSSLAIISVGLCVLSLLLSITMAKIFTVLELAILLHSISFTTHMFNADTKYFPMVSSIFLGLVGIYGFILYTVKRLLDKTLLPEGKPLIKMRTPITSALPCPTFRSRIASDLFKAAKVLEKGEVICVPTDTVYALAGSCSKPDSISKIYHIKGRPPEKPICLCISNLQQLRVANPPFSPLLWRFMDKCYPGGITCVVKKGPWLQNLGVGEAADFVGTKESVAIRVPDSSVLSYLVSITGPLAITSANPSGEPDSTHHNTVLDTLGGKLAGVVCDDESNETVASTVVNCMKIDEGLISYFRVGCVPKDIVDNLFDEVKKEQSDQIN